MPRIARIIALDFPHHIVQRGNRRQQVFFRDNDYEYYLRLLRKHSNESNLEVMAYCLIPNHVHLVAVPKQAKSLAGAIAETHRKYTKMINYRNKWRGYLWQGRFSSYILDEPYLLTTIRYILFNPVRAGIVKRPQDYKWSSIRHHLGIEKNPLIKDDLLKELITDWDEFLKEETKKEDINLLKLHERTGRPLGTQGFIDNLESLLKRNLKKNKPGPKGKHN